jgi:[ribosomal protein S5]-alanine N-acetyltransferase
MPVSAELPGELQLLNPDHEASVLAFELANRAYFARFISDRGDAFFVDYPERHRELLMLQDAGDGAFYVLVGDDDSVLGRFNLNTVRGEVADVGYRVAQGAAGRGVATSGLRELCRLAASRHGVTRLRAATSHANVASQQVLLKAGFAMVGPADTSDIGGKQGSWYELDLDALPSGASPNPRMHKVVAGAMVLDGQVLLVHRSPHRRAFPGVWDLPGGHIEPGESELEALARELHEELGVQIASSSTSHLCRLEAGSGEESVLFSAWLVGAWHGTAANVAPGEHDEIRWFRSRELPPLAHRSLRPVLVAAIRSLGA